MINKRNIFGTSVFYFLILVLLFVNCKKTSEKALIRKPADKKHSVAVITKLGINLLKSETMNDKQVKRITLKIYERLMSIKGREFIAFKEYDGSKIKVDHHLSGTVNRLDSGYSLNVKVVSDLNGNTVYNRVSVVNEEIELDYIINDIAERVVERLW